MKARPASRMPRRFRMVMTTRIPTQSATVCGCSEGTAETSAPTPAEMPAAAWISGDGLAIGKVDDDQQHNNGRADGNDVLHSKNAERNQQAESGFRAVSRGTERVQPEDRNALADADLLGALVAGPEGLADNEIEDVHGRFGPSCDSLLACPFALSWLAKSTAGRCTTRHA